MWWVLNTGWVRNSVVRASPSGSAASGSTSRGVTERRVQPPQGRRGAELGEGEAERVVVDEAQVDALLARGGKDLAGTPRDPDLEGVEERLGAQLEAGRGQ